MGEKNHTTPVSSPMISIGPRVRKSPFFDATMRWGAKAFTVYNHMFKSEKIIAPGIGDS